MPVRDYWAISTYDLETAALTRDVEPSSIDSNMEDVQKNADGTVDLYFGPESPEGGTESNWVQTNKGDGWFVLFRFYGPEKPYYDLSWKLNDFEQIK